MSQPAWVSSTALTGGFLYESTIHLLDMVCYLLGDVVTVYAAGRKGVYGEIDSCAMVFETTSSARVSFASCAHATWLSPFERLELIGDHCVVVTEEMERVLHPPGLGRATVCTSFAQLPLPERWGYVEEDQLFVSRCLDARRHGAAAAGQAAGSRYATPNSQEPQQATAEDGYRAVELAAAIYRSVETGQVIQLPLAD